jgi:hypothetical protein
VAALKNEQATSVPTYVALAFSYFASVVITFSYVSPLLVLEPTARGLALSILTRLAAGAACLLVLASVIAGWPAAQIARCSVRRLSSRRLQGTPATSQRHFRQAARRKRAAADRGR